MSQIHSRRCAGDKPSWTARLLQKPDLLCSKIREEASELCETLEKDEGKQRAASEMADLLYHSMVLLRAQVCETASPSFSASAVQHNVLKTPLCVSGCQPERRLPRAEIALWHYWD